MRVEGACHCGDITFTADVDPATASICHCTDCQTLSGSAFRSTVRAVAGTFALRSGTPTIYVKTTADSGTPREHAFCPRCGTAIYATNVGEGPKAHALRLGTLKNREAIVPSRQIWTRSRVAWLDSVGSLVAVDRQG
jgi:hypothetical protein